MDLFGRAANLDTGQIARDYYNQQQSILNPMRMQENVQLADSLFSSGRSGVGVGMTNTAGQTGYINPEQFALLSAREGQNAELAMNATDRARQMQADDLSKAIGYYGMGQELKATPYKTMNTLFGYGANVEGLGSSTLDAGLSIGNAATTAGANQGQMLMGQENARVAAENTPTMFENLVGQALSAGVSYATGGMSGGGWGRLFSSPTMASNLSGVNNLSNTFMTRYGR
jgi:hypothetical protein